MLTSVFRFSHITHHHLTRARPASSVVKSVSRNSQRTATHLQIIIFIYAMGHCSFGQHCSRVLFSHWIESLLHKRQRPEWTKEEAALVDSPLAAQEPTHSWEDKTLADCSSCQCFQPGRQLLLVLCDAFVIANFAHRVEHLTFKTIFITA